MLDTTAQFEHIDDPFSIHLARSVLSAELVRRLEASAPRDGIQRIEALDPRHEKRYAMNLLYLIEGGERTATAAKLSPDWARLVDELCGDAFSEWLERGTGSKLRHLELDIAVYTHGDGDYISVHKDKPNKAITAILYLNAEWPAEAGGLYEVRASSDADAAPVRVIAPVGGQLLAFPPTDRSWHSVSRVRTGGTRTRLTVQLEYWFDKSRKDRERNRAALAMAST